MIYDLKLVGYLLSYVSQFRPVYLILKNKIVKRDKRELVEPLF